MNYETVIRDLNLCFLLLVSTFKYHFLCFRRDLKGHKLQCNCNLFLALGFLTEINFWRGSSCAYSLNRQMNLKDMSWSNIHAICSKCKVNKQFQCIVKLILPGGGGIRSLPPLVFFFYHP